MIVRDCQNYPKEMQELREEREEYEGMHEEYMKNNPHIVEEKQVK